MATVAPVSMRPSRLSRAAIPSVGDIIRRATLPVTGVGSSVQFDIPAEFGSRNAPSGFCAALDEHRGLLLVAFLFITVCFLVTCYRVWRAWQVAKVNTISATTEVGTPFGAVRGGPTRVLPPTPPAPNATARVAQPPRTPLRRPPATIQEVHDAPLAPAPVTPPFEGPSAPAPRPALEIAEALPAELPAARPPITDGIDIATELATASAALASAAPVLEAQPPATAAAHRSRAAVEKVVHFADADSSAAVPFTAAIVMESVSGSMLQPAVTVTAEPVPESVAEEVPHATTAPLTAAIDAAFSTEAEFDAEPILEAPASPAPDVPAVDNTDAPAIIVVPAPDIRVDHNDPQGSGSPGSVVPPERSDTQVSDSSPGSVVVPAPAADKGSDAQWPELAKKRPARRARRT